MLPASVYRTRSVASFKSIDGLTHNCRRRGTDVEWYDVCVCVIWMASSGAAHLSAAIIAVARPVRRGWRLLERIAQTVHSSRTCIWYRADCWPQHHTPSMFCRVRSYEVYFTKRLIRSTSASVIICLSGRRSHLRIQSWTLNAFYDCSMETP